VLTETYLSERTNAMSDAARVVERPWLEAEALWRYATSAARSSGADALAATCNTGSKTADGTVRLKCRPESEAHLRVRDEDDARPCE
jgi:hypothetical protein